MNRKEPRPGFYATCNARTRAGYAAESLVLALHGKEAAIDDELRDAERYLTDALAAIAEAKEARHRPKIADLIAEDV